MLRSKNLKRILEQALTKDICVCAVFNEDGVVLAHASSERDFSISSLRGNSIRSTSSYLATPHEPDAFSLTGRESPSGSFTPSLGDDLVESSPRLTAREQLDDDLAIAASLWQGYESIATLIENKVEIGTEPDPEPEPEYEDEDMDEPVANINELAMVLVECEYGRVAVTRLGSALRLFLLSRTSAPLGLLKAKADGLTKFLAAALGVAPPLQ